MPSPLVDITEARLTNVPGWSVRETDFWCTVRPDGVETRAQGWKLHVSATVASAPEVLTRVLDVLVPAGCVFKFAGSPEHVRELNGGHYPRGGAGKFVTIYPVDDDQFRCLAAELHQATDGLPGPTILSDRPYRPGSLVHYRYGAFIGEQRLGNDGHLLEVITAPDGSKVEDRRDAWFNPPEWAPLPFPDEQPVVAEEVDGVLLAGRFVVRRAIRHANKGGVFEAIDQVTGDEVIVKQARAGVGDGPDGWDLQAALRNEAEMLDQLGEQSPAPRRIALFDQDGDLFLVQERIDGKTLRAWRAEQPVALPWRETAGRLIDLVAAVHAQGVVLRDLSPLNVMVREDGTLAIIDLEYAALAGTKSVAAVTPGYGAPEISRRDEATPAADHHALGGLLFLLCTGADPILTEAVPPGTDPAQEAKRLEAWLTLIAETDDRTAEALPLILGLRRPDPADRWGLEKARAFLAGNHVPAASANTSASYGPGGLLDNGVSHLLAKLDPNTGERLWPPSVYGDSGDPCNIYHGAAGPMAVLTWVAELREDAAAVDGVQAAAGWIRERLGPSPELLPGLYFGRAGTIVALHEAARLLADDDLSAYAMTQLGRLPLEWPNPDVTHGLAGAGFATLELWNHTHDPALAARARKYAEVLADRAERQAGRLLWPVPDTFDSKLAGLTDYGFAHGTAGIASYLLAAGTRLDEPEWIDLAVEAGRLFDQEALESDEGTLWTSGPNDSRPLDYWCSGSAGIGTFLVRLWRTTGDPRTLELAEGAAEAVWRRRWLAGTSVCHGLAGTGEFLLDLAEATGKELHRFRAEGLAEAIAARAASVDGQLLAPDESMRGFGADYAVGVSGWVAFLLRLQHGGPRRWMAES
ncbi:class IV lanthionine synthetase LanL [Kribbella albertanoniae]|nr:class IV lanthionine synthetase LanL [Kribbella albertanoniae]